MHIPTAAEILTSMLMRVQITPSDAVRLHEEAESDDHLRRLIVQYLRSRPLFINGIDFDKKLNDLKQQLHWRIDYYIAPASKEVTDYLSNIILTQQAMFDGCGIPKYLADEIGQMPTFRKRRVRNRKSRLRL